MHINGASIYKSALVCTSVNIEEVFISESLTLKTELLAGFVTKILKAILKMAQSNQSNALPCNKSIIEELYANVTVYLLIHCSRTNNECLVFSFQSPIENITLIMHFVSFSLQIFILIC